MINKRRIVVLGHTAGWFLAVSYLLCVLFSLAAPQYQMHEVWGPLLPGFEWLTWPGFMMGLIGSYVYGWYIAALWVPLNEYFERRTR